MNIITLSRFFLRSSLGLVSLFSINACTVPEATIQLGGSLSVFSSDQLFDITHAPDDWVVSSSLPKETISITSTLGSTTISVISDSHQYFFARRIQASLLATPYLSWQWKLLQGKWRDHPVKIIVGFSGGGAVSKPPTLFNKLFPRPALPPHDRVLSFIWAPSALMRGNLESMPNSGKSSKQEAHYMVRGGNENVGFWWDETVDLASLYKLSWPTDANSLVQVRFIGIDSIASETPIMTYISDLRLSR